MPTFSPVGNITVVTICFVMIILILFSYIRRSHSFRIFLSLVAFLVLAALADILSYSFVGFGADSFVYTLRCVYHMFLYAIFLGFVLYICEITRLEQKKRIPFMAAAIAIFLIVVGLDIVGTLMAILGAGASDVESLERRSVFIFGYAAFMILLVVLILYVRNRLYRRVMQGFYGAMAVSVAVLLLQGINRQSSFTVATFLYPIIAMFYIMHSNAYDAELGAIDRRALEDWVRFNHEKKNEFKFMSLCLPQFNEDGRVLPEALQATIRRFAADFFRGGVLAQVGRGHIILFFRKDRNKDYEDRVKRILEAFQKEYERFGYDYWLVIGDSMEEISAKNEYVSFIHSIHRRMPLNTTHYVEEIDVRQFNRTENILRQLRDIQGKRDPEDPRILAYCQPVFNLRTGRYDTAEALMRLQLEDVGFVMPSEFIPLAEENGCIHALTEIILGKTCAAIHGLLEQGCDIERISVNVSALELKDDGFCEDILRIIERSGIPGEKIAIELTESQTDSDYLLMKSKIGELHKQGIKFYLDDFGTGYSNMERIMELPFDIIKFDHSMVLASGKSERSRQIVISLANMFAALNYAVLYEGVETDGDESRCKDMCASYLQGFKYSRPVPIEELGDYIKQ